MKAETIKYAGMFEVKLSGLDGIALCVDTDELQEISDAVAEAGFRGLAMDVTHRMDLYDAPEREVRQAKNSRWVHAWIATLKDRQVEEAK